MMTWFAPSLESVCGRLSQAVSDGIFFGSPVGAPLQSFRRPAFVFGALSSRPAYRPETAAGEWLTAQSGTGDLPLLVDSSPPALLAALHRCSRRFAHFPECALLRPNLMCLRTW